MLHVLPAAIEAAARMAVGGYGRVSLIFTRVPFLIQGT